jgi:hypothetical protein
VYNLAVLPYACRSAAEVAALEGKFANPVHFNDAPIEEDACVYGPDGEILARLVTNCLPEWLVSQTAKLFDKVHGDLGARGSVVGKGAQMHRFRADGTLSNTTAVPPSIMKKMRERGTRAGILGFMDKDPRVGECRKTAWSINDPEAHEVAYPFVQEVCRVYREELPAHWLRQREFMNRVSANWKFVGSEVSTIQVNKNVRTTYHYDKGDFAGGMGNLVVLVGGDSGALVMPKFRIAFLPRPTDVLLMNVHELHGNLPFEGERLTAVLFAREHIDECK